MAVIGVWLDRAGSLAECGQLVGDGIELVELTGEVTTLPTHLDACLVDGACLVRRAAVLRRRKISDEPVFFPVLAMVNGQVLDAELERILATADDIVRLPVSPAEWRGRLRCLLAARSRSQAGCELAASRKRVQAVLARLAGGIARDIDGPVQYLGDNLEFLAATFGRLVAALDGLAATAMDPDGEGAALLPGKLAAMLDDEELRFALEEAPAAIRESREGLDRMAALVAAVVRTTAIGPDGRWPADVNEAITDVLVMTRNDYKSLAIVETRLDPDLPPVALDAGVLRLGLIALVACAVRAVQDRGGPDGALCRIVLTASSRGDLVEVSLGVDCQKGCCPAGRVTPEPCIVGFLAGRQASLTCLAREGTQGEEDVFMLSLPGLSGPFLEAG